MSVHSEKKHRRPGIFRQWLFKVRWMWHNREWLPSRQKMKAFDRDMTAYRETGVVPW